MSNINVNKGGPGWNPNIGTGGTSQTAGIQTTSTSLTGGVTTVGRKEGSTGTAGTAESMGLPRPQLSPGDTMLLLQSIQSKIDDNMLASSVGQVTAAKAKSLAAAKEREVKVKEQQEAAAKAEKQAKLAAIFGWLITALTAIAGALLIATGAGASAGAALIATAAVAAIQQSGLGDKILEGLSKGLEALGMKPEIARMIVTGLSTALMVGAGIAAAATGNVAALGVIAQATSGLFSAKNLEAMGVPPDQAGWAAMGLSIGLSVAAMGAAGIQAARAGMNVGTTLANVSDKFTKWASSAFNLTTEQVQRLATNMKAVLSFIQAGTMVAEGGAKIGSAVHGYEASMAEVGVKDTDKLMLKLKQAMQDQQAQMQELIKKMKDSVDIVMDVLSQENATNKRILSV